ncbi:MAG: stage III sporulation protein AE [Peptostreptococcaceae bacterium]
MKNIFLVFTFFILCFSNVSFAQEDYEDTKNNINKYIDEQLNQLNLNEIQNYIDESLVVEKQDIRSFFTDVISGKKSLLDMFSKESIRMILFDEVKSSLKVCSVILVLALLSAILKSLDNSFSSGTISEITNYIIFITMVSFTLVSFNECLEIAMNTIDSTIGLMNVIMPILITLLVLIGLPVTSTILNPIFVGGVTFINVIFKDFLFVSISIAFAILVVNNLSKNIKLTKFANFIKNLNLISIGAVFTIYLGLVSLQGLYVTNIDNFTVKTAKFAVGNFIPVVGNFVSDSVDLILSSSQLIKGVFGGIGLILLISICILPVIKVLSIILVYKLAAIVIEPVGEEKMSSFLSSVASLMTVLLACVIAISTMFFITIAILTSLSVVSG